MDISTIFNQWNVEIFTALMFTFTLYISNIISARFYKEFKNMDKKDKIEWNSRIASNINALICTYGAFKCLFYESLAYTENPYYDVSPSSTFYLRFILGYFFYDTIILFVNHSMIDSATLIHHLMGLLLYYLGISRRYCHFVLVSYLLTEISTPFVNFRWFLYRANKSNDFIYLLNGLLMALGFLLARVLYAPTTIGYALVTKYRLSLSLPGYIWWGTYVGYLAINAINMYWAYLIFRGLYRAMTKSSQSSTTNTTTSTRTVTTSSPNNIKEDEDFTSDNIYNDATTSTSPSKQPSTLPLSPDRASSASVTTTNTADSPSKHTISTPTTINKPIVKYTTSATLSKSPVQKIITIKSLPNPSELKQTVISDDDILNHYVTTSKAKYRVSGISKDRIKVIN